MNNKLVCFDQNFYSKGVKHLCGIDEAGRGALAGPVVSAAVVFKQGAGIDGVNDSKQLSPLKREELFQKIIMDSESWSFGIINNKTIDKVNILEATKLSMLQAVKSIGTEPDFVLIDGVKWKDFPYPYETVIKGDAKSFCIASASIIAKVIRDRIMVKLSRDFPEFFFEENKGYGTKEHLSALLKCGPTVFHRRSFKPVYQPEFIF